MGTHSQHGQSQNTAWGACLAFQSLRRHGEIPSITFLTEVASLAHTGLSQLLSGSHKAFVVRPQDRKEAQLGPCTGHILVRRSTLRRTGRKVAPAA